MGEETRFGIVDNFSFLSYYCLHTLLKRPAQKFHLHEVFQLFMSFLFIIIFVSTAAATAKRRTSD